MFYFCTKKKKKKKKKKEKKKGNLLSYELDLSSAYLWCFRYLHVFGPEMNLLQPDKNKVTLYFFTIYI